VFFGTSIGAVAVIFQTPAGLVQVAIVWGISVTLAICASRHLSFAHQQRYHYHLLRLKACGRKQADNLRVGHRE
jgi:hypothetical protein